MKKRLKVRFRVDNEYEVVEFKYNDEDNYFASFESVFQGSLSDCEAYIRLEENGYML